MAKDERLRVFVGDLLPILQDEAKRRQISVQEVARQMIKAGMRANGLLDDGNDSGIVTGFRGE